MKRSFQRMIGALLALLMVFYAIEPAIGAVAEAPAAGTENAAAFETEANTDEMGEEIYDTALTGADVVGEVEELREADVKHFRLTDGSHIAVQYDTAVHYLSEDDEWADINNSLTEVEETVPVSPAEAGDVGAVGEDVKENIIVKERRDSYTFSFDMDLENLVPAAHEDGSISLLDKDSGEEIYLIPAPYMEDAEGVLSTDVRYELVPASEFYAAREMAGAAAAEEANPDSSVDYKPDAARSEAEEEVEAGSEEVPPPLWRRRRTVSMLPEPAGACMCSR